LPGFVLGLIGLPVDAIVIGSTAAIPVAKRATSIVPIILAYSVDPVATALSKALRARAVTSPGSQARLMTARRSGWSL